MSPSSLLICRFDAGFLPLVLGCSGNLDTRGPLGPLLAASASCWTHVEGWVLLGRNESQGEERQYRETSVLGLMDWREPGGGSPGWLEHMKYQEM